jgi:hypothetical protein
MNDELTRLLDSPDSRVRDALLPALSDDPPPARVRRAALALGLPITAATLSTTTTAAGAIALGVFGKWTAIAVALGLLGGAAVVTQTARKPAASHNPAAASVAPTSAAPAPEPVTTAARALPPPKLHQSAEPSPSSPAVPSRTPSARARAPWPSASTSASPSASISASASTSASPSASLDLEVTLLGAARRELAAGNAGEALRALDAYEKAATRHALAAEATLLRVRALVASGRRAEASAFVVRYTRDRPNDAYAKKLKELVGGPTP